MCENKLYFLFFAVFYYQSIYHTFRADIPARPRICRIIRHKSLACSDILLVVGNNLEGDHNLCGKSVHRKDLQPILIIKQYSVIHIIAFLGNRNINYYKIKIIIISDF